MCLCTDTLSSANHSHLVANSCTASSLDTAHALRQHAQVAAERQALQLLISNTLNELDVFRKVQPLVESVMAQEAAEVQMKETIEHERTTTATVRQLRNDLKDEKIDHEEKVRGSWG